MINSGVLGKVDHVFVETPDDKIPEQEETDAIREMIRKQRTNNINLNWK